mmetsp:Transcript_89127/g.238733  ORF Transcript_89127/g.238733 Transcript_89127/m.238733 type:complete len:249 (-) Transcript_89127:7-753(-)
MHRLLRALPPIQQGAGTGGGRVAGRVLIPAPAACGSRKAHARPLRIRSAPLALLHAAPKAFQLLVEHLDTHRELIHPLPHLLHRVVALTLDGGCSLPAVLLDRRHPHLKLHSVLLPLPLQLLQHLRAPLLNEVRQRPLRLRQRVRQDHQPALQALQLLRRSAAGLGRRVRPGTHPVVQSLEVAPHLTHLILPIPGGLPCGRAPCVRRDRGWGLAPGLRLLLRRSDQRPERSRGRGAAVNMVLHGKKLA